jgi:hypothetical protein
VIDDWIFCQPPAQSKQPLKQTDIGGNDRHFFAAMISSWV